MTDAAAPYPGYGPKPYRAYVLAALFVVYTFNFIDRVLVGILQEAIGADLGISDFQLGLLGGPAFAILYTLTGLPIARAAERHNRISIIAIGAAVWSAMTAACGFAGNFTQLVLARIGVGIGEAACVPASQSVITDYFPSARRATALSIWSMGIPIGAMRRLYAWLGDEFTPAVEAGMRAWLDVNPQGKFGKHDFAYLAEQDVYRCPAGQLLAYWLTTVDGERTIRRYATKSCGSCPLKARCTTAKNRVISRWEHEHVMEAAQKRLDENPQAMRQRRETVEHPFGTLKMRMGATHFLMKTLPRVATEMALHVLAYNLTRVINIMGVKPIIAAMRA